MNYWQMTMDEALEPEKPRQPKRVYETIKGQATYYCPICNWPVGYYSDGSVHREIGWTFRVDKCKNGHNIEWEGAPDDRDC